MSTYNKIPFGNSLILPGVRNGEEFPNLGPAQILEADLTRIAPDKEQDAGSWVLTIRTDQLDDSFSLNYRVSPLVAYIDIGSGGAMQRVEVNAAPYAILQVPSSYVRVSLGWDNPNNNSRTPQIDIPAGQEYTPPSQVKVYATLQRSFAENRARRSILLGRNDVGSLNSFGPVPPFARRFQIYASDEHLFYQNGHIYMGEEYFVGASVTVRTISIYGPQLRQALERGDLIDIPEGSNTWVASCSNTVPPQGPSTCCLPIRLDFEIGL